MLAAVPSGTSEALLTSGQMWVRRCLRGTLARRPHSAPATRGGETSIGCGASAGARVPPGLGMTSREPNLEWLPGAWSASSVSTHAYGVEFLLDTRGGQIEVVWALPSQRATWFTLLVTAFAHITSTAATILAQGDERITAFEQRARRLLDAPTLRRIAQGDADG